MSPEALFKLEVKQRKQWAKGMCATPSVVPSEPPSVDVEAQCCVLKDAKDNKPEHATGTSPLSQANGPVAIPSAGDNGSKLSLGAEGEVNAAAQQGAAKDNASTARSGEPLVKTGSGNQQGANKDTITYIRTGGTDKQVTPVKDQQQPQLERQQQREPVINASDHEEAPLPEKKKTVSKPVAKKAPRKVPQSDNPQVEAACPAEKTKEDFDRELKALRSQQKAKEPKKRTKEPKSKKPDPITGSTSAFSIYNTMMSAGERDAKKGMFISFYREQYAKIGTLDISQYGDQDAAAGLTIKGGHQPMPRPKGKIDLPLDHKKPLNNISESELRTFGCESKRMLICVHGDLFDVSDRPDKYGKDGPYWAMVGHDISWGLVCGNDDSSSYDQYYDIFKLQPADAVDRRLQGLMSWWCFYQKEYGEPVGRLDIYNEEWKLPQPPDVADVCVVM